MTEQKQKALSINTLRLTFLGLLLLSVTAILVGRIDFENFVCACGLGINLGPVNDILVILLACLQAGLVAAVYMGFAYEKPIYAAVCLTGLLFLFVLTALILSDTVFRGAVDEVEGRRIQTTIGQ